IRYWLFAPTAYCLIRILRQRWQRVHVHPFLEQRLCLLERGLAIDAAPFDLVVMDLSRLLGEPVADIIGILLDMAPKLAHRLDELGRLGLLLAGEHRHAALAAAVRLRGDPRGHQLFADRRRAADRAHHLESRILLVIGFAVAEPTVERVLLVADE